MTFRYKKYLTTYLAISLQGKLHELGFDFEATLAELLDFGLLNLKVEQGLNKRVIAVAFLVINFHVHSIDTKFELV